MVLQPYKNFVFFITLVLWGLYSIAYGAECAVGDASIVNGTCCAWYCSNKLDSEDCTNCGGMGSSSCIRINNEYCTYGNWKDVLDGKWLPGRSTHYGETTAGACGFGAAPNCYEGGNLFPEDCAKVPADLKTNLMSGMYAAPQGAYYTQLNSYLSCGECFEIACRDKQCSGNKSITVQLADSCPCEANTKWCCGKESHCGELVAASDGASHCAVTGGQWDNERSIHLDLSNPAFAMLTTGDKNNIGPAGVVNTVFRRVACPVKGNIYIRLSNGIFTQNCSTVYPQPNKLCYYYLSFTVMNAAGFGGIARVQVSAFVLENNQIVQKIIDLPHDPNFSASRVQEQYGGYVNPKGVALYFPIQLLFTSRSGEMVKTKLVQSFDDCHSENCYEDTGVQFAQL